MELVFLGSEQISQISGTRCDLENQPDIDVNAYWPADDLFCSRSCSLFRCKMWLPFLCDDFTLIDLPYKQLCGFAGNFF